MKSPFSDPFDPEVAKDWLAQHYAEIAMIPGWIDYVRQVAREMKDDPRGIYVDMPERIATRIKELKNQKES